MRSALVPPARSAFVSAIVEACILFAWCFGGCGGDDDVRGDPDASAAIDATTADAGADSSPCVPRTCSQLGATCGTAPDRCGGMVSCGECAQGQTCGAAGPNQCGTGTCTPKSCAQIGASCGVVSDDCGQALDCGGCAAPDQCGASGVEGQCGCIPRTCVQLGATCGTAPDWCGGIVECGTCGPGETCGGGGPNRCGTAACMTRSCAQQGASCGVVSDQCSKAIQCGDCPFPEVCGGHGMANQCGCLPKTCAQVGVSCGDVSNGCGNTLHCGECPDSRYECQPSGQCLFVGPTVVFSATASTCPSGWTRLDYHSSFNLSNPVCSGGSVACVTIGNDSGCVHNCSGDGRICVDGFTSPGCHDTTASPSMSVRQDSTAATFSADCTAADTLTLCQAPVEAAPSGWTTVALQTTPCGSVQLASVHVSATAKGSCSANGCEWHLGSGCTGGVFTGGCSNEHGIHSVFVSNAWTPSGACTPDSQTLRYVCLIP